jgi:hypothetical protein
VIDEAAGVDALVTIPQLGPASAFLDIPAEAFARAMETDFSQPALLMRAILPGMTQRGAGAIVNVVAAGALRGLPGSAACAAAGAALLNLSPLCRRGDQAHRGPHQLPGCRPCGLGPVHRLAGFHLRTGPGQRRNPSDDAGQLGPVPGVGHVSGSELPGRDGEGGEPLVRGTRA